MSKLIKALQRRKELRRALDTIITVATPIVLYKRFSPMTMKSQVFVTGRLKLESIIFTKDADIECLNLTELNSKEKYKLKGPRAISMLDWFLHGFVPSWYKLDGEQFTKIN